ncbi:vacuole membrane protein KMS1 [Lathyrus oleraceus]|uniref:Meiotic spindle pole body protein Kms1 n=1 Tax=Pisum sativum TaxID=3888 RepID=A0A9D5AYM2_PEA|nr:vacuole membrane protein KMS1 [Pisum sativum]KAI5423485.1 meiotic spindle pole body protein Kms1 [Pisum sativum]
MGSANLSPSSSGHIDMSISGLHEKHKMELESLTLTTQPFKTLKYFTLAVIQYIKKTMLYLLAKGGWLLLFSVVVGTLGIVLMTQGCLHERHLEEFLEYFRFGLWWVALGVASSIGLGSGLHTFVLYLGPHIALFTIKAMQCGRVDLKSAPYDTIQLKRGPSWLDKNCSQFGPPVFQSEYGSQVPLSSILPQVQMEAVLWGLGTAIGELPPYFISRAARLSGSKVDGMEELDSDNKGLLNQLKCWFFSHTQHLNFFTILVLASVPNPLFDLAGIMCGQFGVPFWSFFLATLIGKAIIKTHIQTVFIISVCNNQLLDWIETEFIRVLSHVPVFASVLPKLVANLHAMKAKYLKAPQPVSPNTQGKKWDFSFTSIWNTVVWLMLMNFFIKIVNSTAQTHLKKQQESEVCTLTKKSDSDTQ